MFILRVHSFVCKNLTHIEQIGDPDKPPKRRGGPFKHATFECYPRQNFTTML